MWNKLYDILLNPNHDFSMTTFLILVVLALLTSYLGRAYAMKRAARREREKNGMKSGKKNIRYAKPQEKKNPPKKKK